MEEIWKLYLLLKPAIDDRELESTGLDEILTIIDLASPQALLASLYIMYDNKIRFETPSEFNALFLSGIAKCDFLGFCSVIRGLNDFSE